MHLTFTSTASMRSALEYYAEVATTHGWTPTNVGLLDLPVSWRKACSNGGSASVGILAPNPRDLSEGPRDHQLNGSSSLLR